MTSESSRLTHQAAIERFRRMSGYRGRGMTLQAIAGLEGISAERVRQILSVGPPNPPGRPPRADDDAPGTLDEARTVAAGLGAPQGGTAARETSAPREAVAADAPVPMQVHAMVVPNRMAFATMGAAAMRRLFFVSTFSVADPMSPAPRQHGYQRDPMELRLAGIARYFQTADHRYLITPIIVSVRLDDESDIAEFIGLFDAGDIDAIHARWHRAVCSVVDGQHRYLGLVRAHEDHPGFEPVVPVMLYFDLDYRDEAEMFDTINSTQRKLPKALIEVTKGDITEADAATHDQLIRNVTFALTRDDDSVWYGQVNMTGARDPSRPVTYEGLRRSTVNMFPMEIVSRLRAIGLEPEQVAKDYWRMVSEACADAWDGRPVDAVDPDTGDIVEVQVDYRIKELVGVASLARLGKDIITSALESEHFEERMSDLVSLLGEVDWIKREGNPWTASHAGFSGQRDLYTKLHNLVYLRSRPGEVVH